MAWLFNKYYSSKNIICQFLLEEPHHQISKIDIERKMKKTF